MKSKENPLLSVLIPLYNHEKYIIDCLESVKNEGYPSIEIIIVDDGSTDGSFQTASNWLNSNDKNFINSRIQSQENQGVAKTLNTLISLSEGEYCLVLASDDILIPNTIHGRIEILESNNELLVLFSDSIPIDESGKELGKSSMELIHNASKSSYAKRPILSLILEWGVCGAVTIAKKDAWDSNRGTGPYPEELEFEDRWFYLKLASMAAIAFIDIPVSKYRVSPHSLSRHPTIDNEDKALDLVKSEFRGIEYFLIELVSRFHRSRKINPKSLRTRLYYVVVHILFKRFFRIF